MSHTQAGKHIWLFVSWFCVGGCASPGLSPLNYTVRHVEGRKRAAVFAAAEAALNELSYGIYHADPAKGTINALPISAIPAEKETRAGSRPGSQTRLRRSAYLRLTQSAAVVNVYCKVVVQEQTTEAHRMFRHDHRVSDIPDDTPIDRDAATTTEQNTVWRTIRRDKATERRILEAILDQAGRHKQP